MLPCSNCGGQPDPQAFERSSGRPARRRCRGSRWPPEGIIHVVRPVERQAPVQQGGGERPPVTGVARHGHRPVAELKPLPVGTLIVQPVARRARIVALAPLSSSPSHSSASSRSARALSRGAPSPAGCRRSQAPPSRTGRRSRGGGRSQPPRRTARPWTGTPRPGRVRPPARGQLAAQRIILRPEAVEQLERSPVSDERRPRPLPRPSARFPARRSYRTAFAAEPIARGRAEVMREFGRRGTGPGFQRVPIR